MPASFPVAYSTLATDLLATRVEADYDVGEVGTCALLHRGLNDSYLVDTASGRHVLRIYRAGWRTADEIAHEITVLEHLGRKSVPAALPVRRRDGAAVDWPGRCAYDTAVFR